MHIFRMVLFARQLVRDGRTTHRISSGTQRFWFMTADASAPLASERSLQSWLTPDLEEALDWQQRCQDFRLSAPEAEGISAGTVFSYSAMARSFQYE